MVSAVEAAPAESKAAFASAANFAKVTFASAILTVVTALSANSVVPTLPETIVALISLVVGLIAS